MDALTHPSLFMLKHSLRDMIFLEVQDGNLMRSPRHEGSRSMYNIEASTFSKIDTWFLVLVFDRGEGCIVVEALIIGFLRRIPPHLRAIRRLGRGRRNKMLSHWKHIDMVEGYDSSVPTFYCRMIDEW